MIIFVITLILLFLIKKYKKNKKISIKYLYIFLITLCISILLEYTVFNYNHFKTKNYNEETLNLIMNDISLNDGVYVIESDNSYIQIKLDNKTVDNIYFDISTQLLPVEIYATDEANEILYKLPKRYIYGAEERTKYIKFNLSGKSKNIRIYFPDSISKNFRLNKIIINKKVPYFIYIDRIIFVWILQFILYIIRPKSELYKYKFNSKSKLQKKLLHLLVVVHILFFMTLSFCVQPQLKNPKYIHHYQYNKLADAMINKKLNIDVDVSNTLLEMKNPYDFNLRNSLMEKNNDSYWWDTAYFEGKYYVYFGVAPVLLSYIPFKLITGHDLKTFYLIIIMCSLTTISIVALLYKIANKYFKDISFLMFLILTTFFINGCGIQAIALLPSFYNIPTLFSMFFIFTGLYFWISSLDDNSRVKMFLGSLFMALTAAARPQFLIASFLIFPIFFNKINKKRIRKEILKDITSLLIPYILVAIPLMMYNYLRFGSITDFGANYNLTANDMTKRGFRLSRIGLGLYYYLFEPAKIGATYPFLQPGIVDTNYMGVTIYEQTFGGIFLTQLPILLTLFIFKFKSLFKNKSLYYISLMCLVFSFIIVILDTNMAGILSRYISDFAWALHLSTFIIIFTIFDSNISDDIKNIFKYVLIFLLVISFIYFILRCFMDYFTADMILSNPKWYFKWYYFIQFWL